MNSLILISLSKGEAFNQFFLVKNSLFSSSAPSAPSAVK